MATHVAQKQIRRKQGTTVAELYQTQPDYQRFNQKFNITRERLWEPAMKHFRRRDEPTQ